MSDVVGPMVTGIMVFVVLTLLCGGECTVTVDGTPHTYSTGGCR